MKALNSKEANEIFNERRSISNGKWCNHSLYTAKAAYAIAKKLHLDCEKAYTMGLLHDIGRSLTDGQFRHITMGYQYMMELGYTDIARICLTHSFPLQDIYTYVGKMDVSKEEQEKFQILLKQCQYDIYDRLIQLCDSISTDKGYVLPEQKFVANAFKYGMKNNTFEKWKMVLEIYELFGERIGMDVFQFLCTAKDQELSVET